MECALNKVSQDRLYFMLTQFEIILQNVSCCNLHGVVYESIMFKHFSCSSNFFYYAWKFLSTASLIFSEGMPCHTKI